jgi:hypothetical protein
MSDTADLGSADVPAEHDDAGEELAEETTAGTI